MHVHWSVCSRFVLFMPHGYGCNEADCDCNAASSNYNKGYFVNKVELFAHYFIRHGQKAYDKECKGVRNCERFRIAQITGLQPNKVEWPDSMTKLLEQSDDKLRKSLIVCAVIST